MLAACRLARGLRGARLGRLGAARALATGAPRPLGAWSLGGLGPARPAPMLDDDSLSPAQLALKWCYTRPHVASTIIGATSLAQLRENVDAYFLDALPEDCEAAVADIYRRYRDPSKT